VATALKFVREGVMGVQSKVNGASVVPPSQLLDAK
jgi:hypothetical protein